MQSSLLKSLVGFALTGLTLTASAQWVAFDDHYSGTGTGANVTDYNVFGTAGGTPSNSGLLKNVATGVTLPVTLSITTSGTVQGGATSGAPNAGTPAYILFNGYIDWGLSGANHAVQVLSSGSGMVTYTFTGLDPSRRYNFAGTGVRGSTDAAYGNRWSIFSLNEAETYENKATAGCYTNGLPSNQIAINTGINLAGDLAVWENINPGADGTFSITCQQYTGTYPGGTAGGTYSYALGAIRLEELAPLNVPVAITSQPLDQSVSELQPATFSVGYVGGPPPAFQWYKTLGGSTAALANATNSSYTIPFSPLSDNGAVFHVVASNFVTNVSFVAISSNATLTVTPDTSTPVLIGAASSFPNLVFVSFSKPVSPATATNIGNYQITYSGGTFSVLNAAMSSDPTSVILTTPSHGLGVTYTLTVNGIRDLTAASNLIAPNSRTNFTSVSFSPGDVGSPGATGAVVAVNGGFIITAGGNDIAGTSDQFTFNKQPRIGDFDVKTRVAGMTLTDAFAKAGLMARETLNANSSFAAAFATPSVSGCFMEYRQATGAATAVMGAYPVTYPSTWLRLKRAGNLFSGYASFDGNSWAPLGSVSITMANSIYVGMAVTSRNTNQTTVARFQDTENVVGGVIRTVLPKREPMGPSSRRTGMVITEIMYNPASVDGITNSLKFIEMFNSQTMYEDISGYRLSGDIDFTFPANTLIPSGGFVVVANSPETIQAYYGIKGVYGPWTNNLSPQSGAVRLRNTRDAIMQEVVYDHQSPWPVAADGSGHSLVLARPSLGESDPAAWEASTKIGGSPGAEDPIPTDPLRNVLINEFLAHAEPGQRDFVELYNHSDQTNNLSGCILTDSLGTNKFVIPTGTLIPPHGFLVFYETETQFGLNTEGETIYLKNADQTCVLDVVRYISQGIGVSMGRFPDGSPEFYRLSTITPNAANSRILIDDIAINEIMYNPVLGDINDQYVELYNQGANTVNLGGWAFTDGITFTFPSNTMLVAGGYLVVAKNTTNLISHYPGLLSAGNTVGDFSGTLSHGGERLALAKPETVVSTNKHGVVKTNIILVDVDEVYFRKGGRWTSGPDGNGSSLELIDTRANHRLAYNWSDSDETAKAGWTTVERTGVLDLGVGAYQADSFHIMMGGGGECLVDNVEVISSTGVNLVTNSTFDAGMASVMAQGSHEQSHWEPNGGVNNSGCLHLIAVGRGDTGPNKVRIWLSSSAAVGSTVTLRAKVRWLRGYPEVLLRLHGNYLEAEGDLAVPLTLGTPGQHNSRAISNAPPAIYEVAHAPVLPAANESAVVTARVDDPDGVSAVTLKYRVDPNTNYTSVPMSDNGTGGDVVAGDGIYSATIPGQPANVMVAFCVEATDGAVSPANSRFPKEAPAQECLVRFGELQLPGNFPTYRIWVTQASFNRWSTREKMNSTPLDATFVYGNRRAMYNIGANYKGSPFISPSYDNPTGVACGYALDFPSDDMFLGASGASLDFLPRDGGCIREQVACWIVGKMGAPFNRRVFINLFVNGVQRKSSNGNFVYEDAQKPDADFLASWFPNDSNGNLFKLDDGFEFNDAGNAFERDNGDTAATLENFVSGGVKKTARYRWHWRQRSTTNATSDYKNLFALVDAANMADTNIYTAQMDTLANIEEWLRVFGGERIAGNWDSYGYRRGKNMYCYKPENGKWEMLTWDIDFVLGSGDGTSQEFFTASDPMITKLYNHPPFKRMYYRILQEAANGPLLDKNVGPFIDGLFKTLTDNNVVGAVNDTATLKSWIAARRSYILDGVITPAASPFSVTGTNFLTTSNNLVTLSGTSPFNVTAIKINGHEVPVTWTGVTGWSIRMALSDKTNQIVLQGYDASGVAITNAIKTNTVVYMGTVPTVQGSVVFNEIMANPLYPNAEYIEVFNNSTSFAFDLSGWRINGLGYTFPYGSVIAPQTTLVLAKDRVAFSAAFGAGIQVYDTYSGNLQAAGESLSLLKPAPTEEDPAAEVLVDRVRYESQAPWPVLPNSRGAALQLIDPSKDRSRVINWSDGSGWRFYSFTATNSGTSKLLKLYPDAAGDIYIDDMKLVAGRVPEVGVNLIVGGDFEGVLTTNQGGPWWFTGAYGTNSALVTNAVHSGISSLHLVYSSGASGFASYPIQQNTLLPTSGVYTLSFWYLPGTNINALNFYMHSTFRPVPSVKPTYFSPGAPNSVSAPLPAMPPIWLNEVQAENRTGPVDAEGNHEPWIELYNSGTTNIDLTGWYLTDTYTNLSRWAFPNNTIIQPGQFLTVWADGQPEQTVGTTNLHANFRLAASSGSVALTTKISENMAVYDYLNYQGLPPNNSYGNAPDGQPFYRQDFYYFTPGQSNNPASAPLRVFINEWIADNLVTRVNPVSAKFDDWFELYNPGTNAVDLGGYFLTSVLTNKFAYKIPAGYVIPPQGYLLVWADNLASSNNLVMSPALHVPFKLSKNGDSIGLFASDGTQIDAVGFGAQITDVSQGRYPDGTGPIVSMTTPTPLAANVYVVPGGSNAPPTLADLPDRHLVLGQTLRFIVQASDPDSQALTYSLDAAPTGMAIATNGELTWTPATSQAPSTNVIAVRVTDTGTPPLFAGKTFNVIVGLPPRFGGGQMVVNGSQLSMSFNTVPGKTYQVEYKDRLSDPSWNSLGGPQTATGATLMINDNLLQQPQRFYRISVSGQ